MKVQLILFRIHDADAGIIRIGHGGINHVQSILSLPHIRNAVFQGAGAEFGGGIFPGIKQWDLR